jgi:hypothetical protein
MIQALTVLTTVIGLGPFSIGFCVNCRRSEMKGKPIQQQGSEKTDVRDEAAGESFCPRERRQREGERDRYRQRQTTEREAREREREGERERERERETAMCCAIVVVLVLWVWHRVANKCVPVQTGSPGHVGNLHVMFCLGRMTSWVTRREGVAVGVTAEGALLLGS